MKRLVPIALLGLMLAACGRREAPAPPSTSTQAPTPTTRSAAAASTSASSLETVGESVNAQLRRQLRDGKADPTVIAQLFAIEVAPLPGVTPPAGRVEDKFEGTDAALRLQSVFLELTPEQRKVAAPYLGLAPFPDAKRQLPPFNLKPFVPPAAATRALRTSPAFRPRPIEAGFLLLPNPPQTAEDKYRAYFQAIYNWSNQAIAGLIGASALSDTFELDLFNDPADAWVLTTDFEFQCADPTVDWLTTPVANCRVADGKGGRKAGDSIDLQRRRRNCHSFINLAKFNGQDEPTIVSVITHEVFHCYQQHAVGSAAEVNLVASWLGEGQPTWVQAKLVSGAVFPALTQRWVTYVSTPKGRLFDRSYDALGFFGHLGDVMGDSEVATHLISGYQAGVGNSGSAYHHLTGANEDAIVDRWGSSYFLAHPGKDLWTMKGPSRGNIPGSGPEVTRVTVGEGDNQSLPAAAEWETTQARVASGADVVEFTLDAGHAAIISGDEGFNRHPTVGEPLRFCNRDEGCACPADTDGTVPPTIAAKLPLDIGLAAGRRTAAAHVSGHSLDEYCKERKSNQPPAAGAGGGSTDGDAPHLGGPAPGEPPYGKASSDPHIATIDGRWYDIQALGEFVLSRSTLDDFLVQVRFGTGAGSRTWSTTVGMATHAGKDRVVVSLNLAAAVPIPTLKINGKASDAEYVRLDGASVRLVQTQWGPGYVVTFSDGTRVGANLTARSGLSVWVNPADDRRGKLAGLLGDGDGNRDNDPVVRGGKRLSDEPGYEELYGTFAPSWRIGQPESLFDYAPGESTATFTDTKFPDPSAPVPAREALQAAATQCTARGVSDKDLLRNCSFDVAASGQKSYLAGYEAQQYRFTYALARAGKLTPEPAVTGNGVASSPVAGSGVTRGLVVEGRITDAKQQPATTFTGGKGDIIVIDPRNCVDLHFSTLKRPDDKEIATSVNCGDRVVLPQDGRYTFLVNRFADHTGEYRYPLVVVRPDRVLDLQLGKAVRGNLEKRGEHDIYRFTIAAPTHVAVDAGSCTGNTAVRLLYGDQDLTAGDLCRFAYDLPKAGTYQMLLNPFDSGIGPYGFTLR